MTQNNFPVEIVMKDFKKRSYYNFRNTSMRQISDDVLQETMIFAMQQWHNKKEEFSQSTWLKCLYKHGKCLFFRKHNPFRQVRVSYKNRNVEISESSTIDVQKETFSEDMLALSECISKANLTALQIEVLDHFLNDRSFDDLAKKKNVSNQSIQQMFCRTVNNLRKIANHGI